MIYTDKHDPFEGKKNITGRSQIISQSCNKVLNDLLSLLELYPSFWLSLSPSRPFFPSLFNFLPPLPVTPPLSDACKHSHTLTHTLPQTESPSHTLSPPATRNAWQDSTVLKYCSPYKVAAASHVTHNLHTAGRAFALHGTHTLETQIHTCKTMLPPSLGWRSKRGEDGKENQMVKKNNNYFPC